MQNTQIKKLSPGDVNEFIELIRVFEDVFEMDDLIMPSDDYLKNLLENVDFMVFVAISYNKVVGGLTGYVLRHYFTTSPMFYLYDLAVQTKLQRRGIGKMLMTELMSNCKLINMEDVFLQADMEDENAIDFYRKTGAKDRPAIQFEYQISHHL